ncbi:MAG: hypothetical protein Q7U58_02575, partial [Hydrogenophaga sp.]|nr:hypothetical protein [Hydrogenophaga sp.]
GQFRFGFVRPDFDVHDGLLVVGVDQILDQSEQAGNLSLREKIRAKAGTASGAGKAGTTQLDQLVIAVPRRPESWDLVGAAELSNSEKRNNMSPQIQKESVLCNNREKPDAKPPSATQCRAACGHR